MLFFSPLFFLFMVPYFIVHRLIPKRWQNSWIIIGSSIFYASWNPSYLWVPYLLILLSFLGTRMKTAGAVVAVCVPLLFFKYTNFAWSNLTRLFGVESEQIIFHALPLGISFVTFTALAYVIDSSRQRFVGESRLDRLASCILFFPHLIAGPIVRPIQLIPQLVDPTKAGGRKMRAGLILFTVGLAKKLLLADVIAPYVNRVYAASPGLDGLDHFVAILGFSLQIYCDFSGYTDMALGLAKLIGIRLPFNFKRPYLARSPVEFWKCWHVTLSTWLRDYIYIPLGGNRGGATLRARNVVLTMAIGGLWHGASWTFVMWGLLHSAGILTAHFFTYFAKARIRQPLPRGLCVLTTFSFTSIAWVLFRSDNIGTSFRILEGTLLPWSEVATRLFPISILFIGALIHRIDHPTLWRFYLRQAPRSVLYPAAASLCALSIALTGGGAAQFIYFDF